jgi:DNA-binding IclR family transcriptional regulator
MNKTLTVRDKILRALMRRKTTINVADLAEKIGHPAPSVRRTLAQMRRDGLVDAISGMWYPTRRAA